VKTSHLTDRRTFLISMAAVGGAAALSPALASAASETNGKKRNIKLGFDNFSIRAFNWKAPQLLEYAASLKLDILFLSDLDVYESLEEKYLQGIKQTADKLGVEIHAGTGSICPSSKSFNKKHGSAEEHLKLAIRVAKTVGSPVARCLIGSGEDRKGDGGIYKHIENTITVCKAVRNYALDANVKIAIENHAGDMQAWELAELIQAAGKEYVGATMDPGNACWTMEDPMVNLEILGPYAATTGIRDSQIWESEKGASVMWTNMGDGLVDWNAYVERFMKLCPGVPFILEVITGTWVRNVDYLAESYWTAFPKARAGEFARFLAMAKRGKPYQPKPGRPAGEKSPDLEKQQQKWDLEQSLKYCKEALGVGLK